MHIEKSSPFIIRSSPTDGRAFLFILRSVWADRQPGRGPGRAGAGVDNGAWRRGMMKVLAAGTHPDGEKFGHQRPNFRGTEWRKSFQDFSANCPGALAGCVPVA